MLVLRFYFRWKSLIANLSRIVRVQEASEHNADRVVDSDILITLIIREKSRGCSSRESDRVFCRIKRRRVSSDLNFRKQQIHRIRPLIERDFAQKRRRYRELEKRKKKEREGRRERSKRTIDASSSCRSSRNVEYVEKYQLTEGNLAYFDGSLKSHAKFQSDVYKSWALSLPPSPPPLSHLDSTLRDSAISRT